VARSFKNNLGPKSLGQKMAHEKWPDEKRVLNVLAWLIGLETLTIHSSGFSLLEQKARLYLHCQKKITKCHFHFIINQCAVGCETNLQGV
jgi:hypothetical protein